MEPYVLISKLQNENGMNFKPHANFCQHQKKKWEGFEVGIRNSHGQLAGCIVTINMEKPIKAFHMVHYLQANRFLLSGLSNMSRFLLLMKTSGRIIKQLNHSFPRT